MGKPKAAQAAALPTLQDRFFTLEEKLNTELVERETEIRASITALVAGQHVFFIGTPGVAKSMQFNRLLAYIDGASKYNILLSRFSTPEEVFGPPSLQAMKEDKYIRKIDGYLPTADLAFVDEIFKANSSILNSLLMAVNERAYRHGTKMIDIPLSSLFCASNELPQDEGLAALYDRLLMRLQIKEIQDSASLVRMLTTSLDPNPAPLLTWDDINTAKAEAAQVVIPVEVIEKLAEIQRHLRQQNIHATPRRLQQSLSIVRAAAWLDGESVAELEHLRPLQHVLWDRPDQQETVMGIVSLAASPLDGEALSLLDEISALRTTCERLATEVSDGRMDEHLMRKSAMQEFNNAQKFLEAYEDLEQRSVHRRRLSEPMLKCHSQLQWLTNFFRQLFKVDELPKSNG